VTSRARPARALRAPSVAVALAFVLAGCVTTLHSFPPPGSTPRPPTDASAATAAVVISALGTQGLEAAVSNRAYRPAEGPLLAGAPRTILQVTLPEDLDHGFIVVYSLASPAAAQAAAEDHAAYLAAGIGGGVQYPPGTEFVLRVVGSTVVFFNWLPANSPDPRTAQIAPALASVGTEVEIPS
jgi:hypothetical protein